jgi:hypothetical protein
VARSQNVGGENPEFILREFMGVNLLDGREAINDNEFYWAENIIPVAPAQAYPVALANLSVNILAETNIPSYTMSFAANGQNYVFVVFEATGNGYIASIPIGSPVLIITGLTSGQTYATPYNNQGILIIDPTGYWDYGVTAPNTLTPQNNTAAFATLTGVAQAVLGGTQLKQIVTATGTGATFQAVYQVINVQLQNAGTGYAVGDTIYLTDGNPTVPATIVVASISGGGSTGPITGITLSAGGQYPGPPTSTLVVTGPTGTVITTTGAGTGATFADHIQAVSMQILTRGSGYTGTTTVVDETATKTIDTWNITSSGVIGGQSIATYQGRVWISFNRTVYFTDINSYNSFGGAGGSFFISDSYLIGNITVLYAANNYLYIFGQSSIDALSNVTITLGVTSFSRINVTGTVGTNFPASVTAYFRAILFYHSSGIYLLAGATPEKISEKISQIIALPNTGQPYGFTVQVQGEICAGMQISFVDNFTQTSVQRPLCMLYFRGRWWFSSYTNPSPTFVTTAITSIPINGVATAFGWRADVSGAGAQLYELFASGTLSSWLVKTKFWDGGSPTREKQSINAGVAGLWPNGGVSGGGLTVNVDTEFGTSAANITSPAPNVGYNFEVTIGNEGGSQYLGLTVAGASAGAPAMTRLDMLALRGKTERDMLQ